MTTRRFVARFSMAAPVVGERTWEASRGEIQRWIEVATSILDALAITGDEGAFDLLVGVTIPEPIEIGDTGNIGDASLGFAPINHEHPVDLSIPQLKQVELDFGPLAVVEKVFTVLDAQVGPTSRIVMIQSGQAATGKQADEAEFDAIDCRCEPLAGSFRVYATSLLGSVFGKFRFNYVLATP